MTKKAFVRAIVILLILSVTGCASEAPAVVTENIVLESIREEVDSAGKESGMEESKEKESPKREYDTTIYTIRQPDGASLSIQQTGLTVDEEALMYTFECTFQVMDAATNEELQTITFWSSFASPLAETGDPFEDLNFDGYSDLTFDTYHAQNDDTITYLWHPDTRRFEKWNLFFGAGYWRNPAMKQISEHVHGSAISGMDSVYRFVNSYETQLVWTVDYTYDRYDTDVEDDARFLIYWYPDGEGEVFIDDTFFCAEDLSNTDFYWDISVSEITDAVPVSGGTVYHAYFIYPPASDPEGHIHHYVYLVTDDRHLGAHGETECDKDVTDMAVAQSGGKYVVTLTYVDGTEESIELETY